MNYEKFPLVESIRQSPPIDFEGTVDDAWVKDKTILITGGASGFGAGFLKRWATRGATVIIGDINVAGGEKIIEETRTETGNPNLHFIPCNVTDWMSQVKFFKAAVKLSPHGGIDTVVANAGIAKVDPTFENPQDLDSANPPPPNMAVMDVNMTGVIYTTHLSLFYLKRNPGSKPANPECKPADTQRDRHLVLVSSCAGLMPIPGQAFYGASKHAVVGLYRNLRSTSFVHGIRINMIAPYFIDTPMVPTRLKVLLAGGHIGKPEDVIEAVTRFVADPRIAGRAALVGPKFRVKQDANGDWDLANTPQDGEEKAIWEIYADDFEDSDLFQR
ncbi:MAG: hypothetical protein Q9195_002702 [Heterodermia aff. obscurata]